MFQSLQSFPRRNLRGLRVLLAAVTAGGVFVSALAGQSPVVPVAPAQVAKAGPGPVTTYEPNHFPKREHSYYELFWGVDSLNAKSVESGELIKFTFRVIDPEKAKTLNDKTLQPAMYDPAIHAKLVIPTLEKVGQLRQAQTPEAGVTYWMAFSNPGRVVKRGDRVTVIIGDFHVENLLVQ
jgi:hypothetical protein